MMRKLCLYLALVLCTTVHADDSNECTIITDTAESLMQIKQGGFDLGEVEMNEEALSQQQAKILSLMIEDIKTVPIYKMEVMQQKALKVFEEKWMRLCLSETKKK